MTNEKVVFSALEELEQPIAPEQLTILRNQLKSEEPDPTPQTKFNYAWGLLKTPSKKGQKEGMQILTYLYKDVPEMRRECLYYLCLGSYQLGDYSNARRYVDTLLKAEPENTQAKALKHSIEEKITRDGLIGLGIAGGVLAVGVGLIGALARRKR